MSLFATLRTFLGRAGIWYGKNRDRIPSFITKKIDKNTRGRGVLGRLHDRIVYRYSKSDTPSNNVALVQEKKTKLYIAPANFSQQGYTWARAVERKYPDVQAVSMMPTGTTDYEIMADITVPESIYWRSRSWHDSQERYISEFSHILIEAERPLLGRRYNSSAFEEAQLFSDKGIAVAFICHGTDVRVPSTNIRETRWSPFFDNSLPIAAIEKTALENIKGLYNSGKPVFVSTPDLLIDVPYALWCPVAINPAIWSAPEKNLTNPILSVVHVPSNTSLKGSNLIEPTLLSLHAQGLIQYSSPRGVPHDKMPSLYKSADIVLDQFRIGSYGVSAVEAMASRALVLGHVTNKVREIVHENSGKDLPILESTPDTLEEVLRDIVKNRDLYREKIVEGVEFVHAIHNGDYSARRLYDNFLGIQ